VNEESGRLQQRSAQIGGSEMLEKMISTFDILAYVSEFNRELIFTQGYI
jgi:hypothetical protein